MSQKGDPPVPPALLLGTPPSVLVPSSSAPNSCPAGLGSTGEVLFCVWSPWGLSLPGGDLGARTASGGAVPPLLLQTHSSGPGDLS